jgi:hypothetical protein
MAAKKTRTGKKLTAEGKVAVPSVTRDESGKIRATTEEEKRAARTTVLPTADRDKVRGAKETKRQGVMGVGASPVRKGFKSSYPVVEKATKAALGHLSTMHNSQPHTPEHQEASQAFHLIHANIGQMSPELHLSLKQAHHEVTHPGPKTAGNLAIIHKAITARLAIGRAAHEDNIRRSEEGMNKKAGN